jgi:ABC-type xylose transport system permease subunit
MLRFSNGVAKRKEKTNLEMVSFWSTLIVFLALLSAILYGLRLGYESSFLLSFLQIPIFLLAVLFFVVFSGIGQVYLNRN